MKTEPELKKLAEFAAEFIGVVHDDLDKSIQGFFYNDIDAPILAHLALKEMEKRFGDVWECASWISKNRRVYEYKFSNHVEEYNGWDENEYIALWSAIKATGEK